MITSYHCGRRALVRALWALQELACPMTEAGRPSRPTSASPGYLTSIAGHDAHPDRRRDLDERVGGDRRISGPSIRPLRPDRRADEAGFAPYLTSCTWARPS